MSHYYLCASEVIKEFANELQIENDYQETLSGTAEEWSHVMLAIFDRLF